MSRFHRAPASPPDIAGMVKEAVSEFLLARARELRTRDERLGYIGIHNFDIDDIAEAVTEALRNEERIADDAEIDLGARDPIDTVGQLIDAVEAAFKAVQTSPENA